MSKKRSLVFLVAWIITLMVTLGGVYFYYGKKLEQIDHSIENTPRHPSEDPLPDIR